MNNPTPDGPAAYSHPPLRGVRRFPGAPATWRRQAAPAPNFDAMLLRLPPQPAPNSAGPSAHFNKCAQALIERGGVLPKRCVADVGHHMDLGVGEATLVLIHDLWLHNGIFRAVRDQRRFADPGRRSSLSKARENRPCRT